MNRRTSRTRAYAPDPGAPGRCCDSDGCGRAGEYRAPKSRDALNEYWWFCIDHVRAYNLRWDFYKGMSASQIEAQTRADTSWQRPTWPLGKLGGGHPTEEDLLAPLALLLARRRGQEPARPRAPAGLREPLSVLGLDWPVDEPGAKIRYKELAKRYHPDANGGDRAAEEKLKAINAAYAVLRRALRGESLARTA